MNKHHLMAAAEMLERYSDALGRNVCNDIDLADINIPEAEWEAFDKLAEEINRTPGEHVPGQEPSKYREKQPDFAVAHTLAQILRNEATKQ